MWLRFWTRSRSARLSRPPQSGSVCPGVEVAAVGQVVVDEAGEDAGHERVAVAVALEVVLDLL